LEALAVSSFRVVPNALREERDKLEVVYRELCQDMAELSGVIRKLESMTEFDGPISALRRVQRKGSEQQTGIRQSARTLERITDLYIRTERQNCEDVPETSIAWAVSGSWILDPTPFPFPFRPVWTVWNMLNDPETLFGVPIVIRRK